MEVSPKMHGLSCWLVFRFTGNVLSCFSGERLCRTRHWLSIVLRYSSKSFVKEMLSQGRQSAAALMGKGQKCVPVTRYCNILTFQLGRRLQRWWGESWDHSFASDLILTIYICQTYSWWGKWADGLAASKTAGLAVATCNPVLMADACSTSS